MSMHVYLGAHKDPRRILYSMELELWVLASFLMQVLGIELGSSVRSVSNHFYLLGHLTIINLFFLPQIFEIHREVLFVPSGFPEDRLT